MVASTPPPTIPTEEPIIEDETIPGTDEDEPLPNSQSSTKENDAPLDVPATWTSAFRPEDHRAQCPVQHADEVDIEAGALPPDLLSMYTRSRDVLEKDFSHSPPYTIQRLAELVLYPKKTYRFLPAYLRALDRVVSVNSPVTDFPLAFSPAPVNGSFLTNGDSTMVNGISERDSLGSDESLGGALLTPIPWLNTTTLASAASAASQNESELRSEHKETIEGPNGAGSIETVSVTVNGVPSATSLAHTSPAQATSPTSPTLSEQSDASSSSSSSEAQMREHGAITQGELIRQEQEAGLIPQNQVPTRRPLMNLSQTVAARRETQELQRQPLSDSGGDPLDEVPHARGPDLIGVEDTGLQPTDPHGDMHISVHTTSAAAPLPTSGSPPQPYTNATWPASMTNDHAGEPGQDPADVEKEVEMLKEALDQDKEDEAHNEGGDIVVADADGRPIEEKERMEITGDLNGADASDTTTL